MARRGGEGPPGRRELAGLRGFRVPAGFLGEILRFIHTKFPRSTYALEKLQLLLHLRSIKQRPR